MEVLGGGARFCDGCDWLKHFYVGFVGRGIQTELRDDDVWTSGSTKLDAASYPTGVLY